MNYQVIQQSLLGKSKLNIYKDFKKMVKRYHLIMEKDIIAVEISADKNSLTLLSCLNEFCKENGSAFELRYFLVKEGNEISKEMQQIIEAFEIKEYVCLEQENIDEVYIKMQEQGCTKVALPNNYNDIINSTFMTLMQRKEAAQLQPKRCSNQVEKLQFIRPLCIIEDTSIIKWLEGMQIQVVEELTLLSRLAFVEEDVVYSEYGQNAKYEFSIYERI
ncbi:MAG: ATP-binding protein [bacterium]|nr:ATP-binding protein [bacterium]